jgi:hypothetical protein
MPSIDKLGVIRSLQSGCEHLNLLTNIYRPYMQHVQGKSSQYCMHSQAAQHTTKALLLKKWTRLHVTVHLLTGSRLL